MNIIQRLFRLPKSSSGLPLGEYEFASLCTSRAAIISWWFISFWLIKNLLQVIIYYGDFSFRLLVSPHGFGIDLFFVLIFILANGVATYLYFSSNETRNVAVLFTFSSIYILVLPLFLQNHFTPGLIPYYFIALIVIHLAALLLSKLYAAISILLMSILYYLELHHYFFDNSLGWPVQYRNYFLFLWIVVAPFATIYLRHSIFPRLITMDSSSEMFYEKEKKRIAHIRGVNEVDPVNIALHGTILNTLVVLDKAEFLTTRENLAIQIKSDLEIFRRAQQGETGSLGEELENSLHEVAIEKVNVDVKVEEFIFLDNSIRRVIIEIAREMIINIDRHTPATIVSLEIKVDRRGKVIITTRDNSLRDVTAGELKRIVEKTNSSQTLKRLIRNIPHSSEVTPHLQDGEMQLSITLYPLDLEKRERSRLSLTRNDGIHAVARFLIIAAALFSLTFIPLYIYEKFSLFHILLLELIPFLISTLFVIFRFRKLDQVISKGMMLERLRKSITSKGVQQEFRHEPLALFGNWSVTHRALIALAISSPIGLLILESHRLACENFEMNNWMLVNVLFMLCGAAIMAPQIKVKVVIAFEALFTIVDINANQAEICRNYPGGAFAFLGLGVFVIFVVVLLRWQSINFLHNLLTELADHKTQSPDFLSAIVQRRKQVVESVEEFFDRIMVNEVEWDEIVNHSRKLKNNIRNFLVASEYFDIPLHVELYDILLERSAAGAASRMEIYGTPPTYMTTYFNYRKHLDLFNKIGPDEPLLMEIIYERNPRINVYADRRAFNDFDIDSKISGEVFEISFFELKEAEL